MSEDKNFNINPYLEEILSQVESAISVLNLGILEYNRYHYFLIHSSIVYKILNSYIFYNDSEKIKELKNKRKKALEEYFGIKYNYFINKLESLLGKGKDGFRNHLEHIDERIDIAVEKGGIVRNNISQGISFASVFNLPKECFLENYENFKFSFLGEVFDLNEVKIIILEIKEYIDTKGLPESTSCFNISNNSFLM